MASAFLIFPILRIYSAHCAMYAMLSDWVKLSATWELGAVCWRVDVVVFRLFSLGWWLPSSCGMSDRLTSHKLTVLNPILNLFFYPYLISRLNSFDLCQNVLRFYPKPNYKYALKKLDWISTFLWVLGSVSTFWMVRPFGLWSCLSAYLSWISSAPA